MLPAPPPDLAPPSTPEGPSHRMALGLVLAFGLMTLSSVAFSIVFYLARESRSGSFESLMLIRTGVNVAYVALAIAGSIDLHRRTTGTAQLGARVALGASILMLVATVSGLYLRMFYLPGHSDSFETYLVMEKWVGRGHALAWLGLSVGIVVAGLHAPRIRVLGPALVVVTLIAAPFDFYGKELYGLLYGSDFASTRGFIVNALIDGTLAALAIAILHASAPRADTLGFERAGHALDRVALGLFVQVWVLLVSVVLILMLFGSRGSGGEGVAKLYTIGAPLVVVIAVLITISGVLGAAGLLAPGAPRLSLYAAGVGFTITFTITVIQTLLLLQGLDGFDGNSAYDRSDQLALARALPIFKPVLGLATLLALGLGLHGLGHMLGDRELEARAGRAIGVVVICQLIGIVIPWAMMGAPNVGAGDVLFALIAVAATGVISLVVLARTCRALASALRARHDLPVARVFS